MSVVEATLQLWPQWITTLTEYVIGSFPTSRDCTIVCILSISIGLANGWTSPYLAILISADSPMPINLTEASWVASLMPLGRAVGAIFGAIAIEFVGCKQTLLLTGIPLAIGWVCIIIANTTTWLYVSRTFLGSSMGMMYSCFPLYVAEISAPKIRGALVGLVMNGILLGSLMGNIMGPNISIAFYGTVGLVINLIFMSIFPFVPDSAHHLIRQDEPEKAKQIIRWYNRKSDVNTEFEEVLRYVRASNSTTLHERFREMMVAKNRRAFQIIAALFIFIQLSGVQNVISYMEIILRRAKVTFMEPSSMVVAVNATWIVIGWCAMYAVDRCGRRILLISSCCGVILGMTLLGTHFMLLSFEYDPTTLEWLPILALLFFMTKSLGLVLVPNVLLGELFQANLKSIAGFVASILGAIFAFIVGVTYQHLVNLVSEHFVFWTYGSFILVCLVYSIIWVPETKGKTLHEIQDMLTDVTSETNSPQQVGTMT